MTKILVVVSVVVTSCAPGAASTAPSPTCVTQGGHVEFLKSITAERLADSAWAAALGWKASSGEVRLLSEGPMCSRAATALDRAVVPTRPDSVVVVQAGNRFATLRTSQVDAVMIVDQSGRNLALFSVH